MANVKNNAAGESAAGKDSPAITNGFQTSFKETLRGSSKNNIKGRDLQKIPLRMPKLDPRKNEKGCMLAMDGTLVIQLQKIDVQDPFRFQLMWLRHKDIAKYVQQWWLEGKP
ncbi:hypothetical protein KI387_025764, partial [Taxus chinensis]